MSSKALSTTLALLLVCLGRGFAQSSTASHALILEEIDEADLVTLAGNTRPEVQFARDLGPVSDNLQMSHMYLQMKMSPEQEADVAAVIGRLHDPSAARYHQWLSLAEIEDRFGPAREDIHKVSSWLESHGFAVNVVYPGNGVIDFSGPAGAIREAFHTEIDTIDMNGARHIANIRDPQIPAALAPAIAGVASMNDFRPHSNFLPRKQFNTGNFLPFALVPGDLATIYDFNPVYKAGFSGKGQTVVVIEDSDIFSAADWNMFRRTFGLEARFPFGSLTQIHPQPPSNSLQAATCVDPGINSDDAEAEVDAEWSSAAAPNAAIVVATCADTNTNFGGFIAMQNLVHRVAPPPGIISISYGASESQNGAGLNAYINGLYRMAVLRGVSVFVATGDAGADTTDEFLQAAVSGLNVSGFATTQYNVAVGGSDFADTFLKQNANYWNPANGLFFASAKSYIPEIPWNDSCAGRLASTFFGSGAAPYGAHGFCNSGSDLEVAAGSGGASSCFSGAPAMLGIVGGTCKGYPKPDYQDQAPGIPRDLVRDIPDVTVFASNGFWGHYYVLCYSDLNNFGSPCVAGHPEAWAGGGGTSFGAPIMAGVQALVNESVGKRFQGNPNYVYYRLSALQPQSDCNAKLGAHIKPSCVFHDLTFGDMDVNCRPLTNSLTGFVIGRFNCFLPSGENGVMSRFNDKYEPTYSAKPGYDLASGIGSVDVFALVKAWPGSRLH